MNLTFILVQMKEIAKNPSVEGADLLKQMATTSQLDTIQKVKALLEETPLNYKALLKAVDEALLEYNIRVISPSPEKGRDTPLSVYDA